MLYSTKPKTDAEAAILARARQLTDFKWTPIRDVPTYTKAQGQMVLPAGTEVTGFPYSSTERTDKFLTENVSIESFLTAIPNPHSKLYQPGHGALSACNYGIVCNGFVRYAFGIRRRVSTSRWFTIPGMRLIAPKQQYSAEDIRLLDVLHAFGEGINHVALITDILRGEDGNIVEIEVSEAVRPSCKRARYTPDRFFEHFKLFGLCRYDGIEQAPAYNMEDHRLLTESGMEKLTPGITVDNGNKSNYLVGDEIIISVFGEEEDTAELYRGDELISEYRIGAKAMIPFRLDRGYYTVKRKNAGDSVEFCVNRAEIRHEVHDGMITVYADSCDENSKLLYADFRQAGDGCAALEKFEELTEEEKQTGCFTRPIPGNAENFKVYWQNPYGVWTHPMESI